MNKISAFRVPADDFVTGVMPTCDTGGVAGVSSIAPPRLPMKGQCVCIDGFNLSMPKGSGIATYARNLNLNLRGLGAATQILYGPAAKVSRHNLMRQVALVDAAPSESRSNVVQRYLQARLAARRRTAIAIEPTGEVIWPGGGGAPPPAECYWAAQDLFHRANRAFRRQHVFTKLNLDGKSADERSKPDVMHWTCALPLYTPHIPNIYTIHDLIPLRLPHTTLDNKRSFFELCKKIVKKADHIVTVSETTRQDVIRLLGASPDRVSNTYQSVSIPDQLLAKTDADVAAEVEGVFDLGWKGYYLFFGAIEPKKNLGRVIEAYLASGVKSPLVVIGGRAWLDDAETALLYEDLVVVSAIHEGRIRRSDRIRRYDYLPFALLISLIRGARATLFPSLYEGFGLPVLESMLLGTPVLTSTAGSLPEVAGDAAMMVDPYDVDAIKKGIQTLEVDHDLRADLVERGRSRAVVFSPEAYRTRLVDLHRRLI